MLPMEKLKEPLKSEVTAQDWRSMSAQTLTHPPSPDIVTQASANSPFFSW